MKQEATVQELADLVGGTATGATDRRITGVASIPHARPGDIVFVEQARFLDQLGESQASAAIVYQGANVDTQMATIESPFPALAMAKVTDFLYPRRRHFTEVSAAANIGENVELEAGVGVAPGVHIGDGAHIGAGTEIHPNATIGAGTRIGANCVIYAGVHIYHECQIGSRVIIHSGVVLGADGYGFLQEPVADNPEEPVRHRKIQQVGNVVVEDDVEIGANTTIDRAAFDVTRIRRGTKIDNLVMLGHNTSIGRHCLLAGQTGIAGSTSLGDYVTLAGQVGVTGHVHIGSRAVVGAQSGVTGNLDGSKTYLGFPATEMSRARRTYATLPHLPEIRKRASELERRVRRLEKEAGVEVDDSGTTEG